MSVNAAKIKIVFWDIKNHDKMEAQLAMKQLFNDTLAGKILRSDNYTKDNPDEYRVTKCTCDYSSGDFFSVNVYFSNYNADNYFLYGDRTMEKQIQDAFPYLYLGYSESGMQGDDYINLDVTANKDPWQK